MEKELKKIPSGIFIPLSIFILLAVMLAASVYFINRPPRIVKLEPSAALPGERIEIYGKNFGAEKDGSEVVIAGIKPTLSNYISWSDGKIIIEVPDDVKSGRLYVKTSAGISNGPLFINKEYVPVIIEGPSKPGEPYIRSVSPRKGSVGSEVMIEGSNFGLSQGKGEVFFSFYSSGRNEGIENPGEDNFISCSSLDFDYASWSSQKIIVYVPDGATSGAVKVRTDRGESNFIYFEVVNPAGTKLYGQKRGYQIQYSVSISDIVTDGDGGELELWIPGVYKSKAQRNMEAVFDPQPMWEDYKGLMMYQINQIEPWRVYKFVHNYWFERYSVETDINPQRLNRKYNKDRKLYSYYTDENIFTPVNDKSIHDIALSLTRRESNPYLKAEKIYKYLLKRLEYDAGASDLTPLEALEKRKGDAYSYAILFTSLARSAKIPSRTVAGYLVYGNKQTQKHWWSEFYLEGFGWVPVDPALGDGMHINGLKLPDNPVKYYFGNADNQRIIFSKGLIEIKPINPEGRTVRKDRSYSLQTVNEEYSMSIRSYKSSWSDIQVVDWW